MKCLSFGLLLLLVSTPSIADDLGPLRFEFTQLAPDVWAGVRPDSSRYPVMGNTTFVLGDDGVIVFDGGGLPAMADQVIDKIRSLTDDPVSHVVISHWHGDHHFGVHRFTEAFPDVRIVAHRFTDRVLHSPRIQYIDRDRKFAEERLPAYRKMVDTGLHPDGNEVSETSMRFYRQIVDDGATLQADFPRARITAPDVVFDERHVIRSGDLVVELLHLGHGNTEGDIVMWLPHRKIVAAGDLVVLPSPYAFNVPPRPWAETLRRLNGLGYTTLVPGHGAIQSDTAYVDLLIEVAESIADQRDGLLAAGKTVDEVESALDFSPWEDRFTGGDPYRKRFYERWFTGPFRKAAVKALTGEPMVEIARAEILPFDDEHWQIEAGESELVSYLGHDALRLRGGSAVLKNREIRNGAVEFDIAFGPQRNFAGLMFRRQDRDHYEHFYLRPHQSGNPDATQYTPVFHGMSGWQLYHGEGYATPVPYRFDAWMHVKIVFAETRATVSIDSDEPVLHVHELKRDVAAGGIALTAAGLAHAYFANVKVTPLADAYALRNRDRREPPATAGWITRWHVSPPFDGRQLEGRVSLPAHLRDTAGADLETEANGLANLARLHGRAEGKDTVVARATVSSDDGAPQLLRLGYSDAARVYLNGSLLYRGDNTYRSRDYRYLGTIGLFDAVVLPLRKGENELSIAVTEAFGGWGLGGRLEPLTGEP